MKKQEIVELLNMGENCEIESIEKSKNEMILEEYDINNIDKETFESYRKRFRIHKGDNHE